VNQSSVRYPGRAPRARPAHPLLGAPVLAAIERAASAHRGRRWVGQGFTSLDDRASHPCGILHGTPFSVFAKLGPAVGAREQFTAELTGLRLLRRAAPVPVPVTSGLAKTPAGLAAYLAVVAVDGSGSFGRRYLDRMAGAVRFDGSTRPSA
jgi:hypothetical protein